MFTSCQVTLVGILIFLHCPVWVCFLEKICCSYSSCLILCNLKSIIDQVKKEIITDKSNKM